VNLKIPNYLQDRKIHQTATVNESTPVAEMLASIRIV